ncbi:MAG: zinc ribbon domain-containing protein [Bdellovibrionota bacterium]
MPIFEYTCEKCKKGFELFLQNGEKAACPSCGGTKLEKRFSVFGVGKSEGASFSGAPGPCGSCGDPRGPGSCAMD